MATRKPKYAELEAMYRERDKRLSAHEILVHLQIVGSDPIRARLNKGETTHNEDDSWSALWFGADRIDGGVILLVQRYGQGNAFNALVLWHSELETSTDVVFSTLMSKLRQARFRELAA